MKDQAGIGRQLAHDAVEVLLAAHHRPEMADDLGVVELRERGLGDHFQRFAGRIREEVEMEPGHVDNHRHKPRERIPDKFGSGFGPH